MTLFDGIPPFYPERVAPSMMANDTLYLIYSACVMILALMIILPGFQSLERVLFGIHWGFSLLIGGSIIACIFGVHWHVSEETTEIPFLRGEKVVLNATLGLKIGLHSFNVTLQGFKQGKSMPDLSFTEQYFFLTTDEQMETALKRGMPSPILNIVEHFSGSRISSIWPWSRRYWIVGHFSSYLLWTAFAAWLFFNLIIHAVVKYGSLCLCATGALMIFANVSFASITRYGQPLVTVGYYSKNAVLGLRFGWCFWLCLFIGILCIFWSAFLFYEDVYNQKAIRLFFNIENDLGLEFNKVAYVRRKSTVSTSSTPIPTKEANSKQTESLNHAFESEEHQFNDGKSIEDHPAHCHNDPQVQVHSNSHEDCCSSNGEVSNPAVSTAVTDTKF